MAQQALVVMLDGSEYEWDTIDQAYRCTHANVKIEDVEVDTMRNGEHDTYMSKSAICANPECEEDLTDTYDFGQDEWYE